jgi:hypothetical protein
MKVSDIKKRATAEGAGDAEIDRRAPLVVLVAAQCLLVH